MCMCMHVHMYMNYAYMGAASTCLRIQNLKSLESYAQGLRRFFRVQEKSDIHPPFTFLFYEGLQLIGWCLHTEGTPLLYSF